MSRATENVWSAIREGHGGAKPIVPVSFGSRERVAAHTGECRGSDLDMLLELAAEFRERNAQEAAAASPIFTLQLPSAPVART